MKIGFFGGSFNPPTNAHINLAKKTLKQCKLDKIILIPMNDNYQKPNLAKAEHRLKMLEIACKNIKNIETSDIELKINKELSTIEAFTLIEQNYPDDEKYFIMGADNFIKIRNWNQSQKLQNAYKYIILRRNQIDLNQYIKTNAELKKNIYKIIENSEYKNSSSTMFRNLLNQKKAGKQDIIPEEVYKYIKKYKIY